MSSSSLSSSARPAVRFGSMIHIRKYERSLDVTDSNESYNHSCSIDNRCNSTRIAGIGKENIAYLTLGWNYKEYNVEDYKEHKRRQRQQQRKIKQRDIAMLPFRLLSVVGKRNNDVSRQEQKEARQKIRNDENEELSVAYFRALQPKERVHLLRQYGFSLSEIWFHHFKTISVAKQAQNERVRRHHDELLKAQWQRRTQKHVCRRVGGKYF